MSMPIFIDTSYILALVNTSDEHHQQARAASQSIQPPFIMTEAVLTEIGNALSRQRWQALALATIHDLRTDPEIDVLSVDKSKTTIILCHSLATANVVIIILNQKTNEL